MRVRLLVFLAILIFTPINVYSSNTDNDFDLKVLVPSELSEIGIRWDGPIQRYIAGYAKGFLDALEKYYKHKALEPEKVNGWGEFIIGYEEGFMNAKMQLYKLEKNIGKKSLLLLLKETLEED